MATIDTLFAQNNVAINNIGTGAGVTFQNVVTQTINVLLSAGVRKKAKRLWVSFSFLFMRAQGNQLSQITSLIDSGIIHPVIDKVFPFEATNEALAYVESGRAKGKVVVKVRK